MANSKISALTALTGAGVAAATDVIPIVDVSAGAAGSKKITVEEFFGALTLVPFNTAATSLTGANVVIASDTIPIVDASAGTTGSKKITVEELWKAFSLVSYNAAVSPITGANLAVATDVLPILDVSAGATGSKTVTIEELFKTASLTPYADIIVMNKATNKGFKVDTTTPTYPYHDIMGQIHVRGSGAADPAWSTFLSPLSAYEFSATVEKEVWIEYHIPHDYVPGTDIFFHAHWGNAAAVPNTGNVVWGFDYTYARGYNQQAFAAATTITVTQASPATRYQHNIAETVAVTIPNLEVDGLIICRVYRKAADAADTCTDTAFLFTADVHYQSTGMGTKAKNGPAFYT